MKKASLSFTIWLIALAITCSCASCKSAKKDSASADSTAISPVGPKFNPDSAYAYCAAQCDFGPRTMNSTAHEQCAEWIIDKFRQYGCEVETQKTTLKGWDGKDLKSTNIIAHYNPKATTRVLICAHWDSRPWADNDPDSANHHKPVMAANDGASGVAVMIELARTISKDGKLPLGVDFVCFDAEDYGTPYWAETQDESSWALGAQYWADKAKQSKYEARYGILLDMVGGQGATFYQEGMSKQFAQAIVDKVWKAAGAAGYGSFFSMSEGGMITDDHVPVNQKAGIPTIDIIPYYPDCQQSNFGPTWHTISDTMENIDKNTLQAVGQTVIQVLYSEK